MICSLSMKYIHIHNNYILPVADLGGYFPSQDMQKNGMCFHKNTVTLKHSNSCKWCYFCTFQCIKSISSEG